MDYKLHIATVPSAPVSILDARFVTTTKATWSYAPNAPNQSLVYAKKQLCDASGAVVATLSRKAFYCAYDTYAVASPYLQVPGTITTSVNYCPGRTAYTWVIDNRGSELELSASGFSLRPVITLSTPTQEARVVATVGANNTVTIEAGVDAAAVIVLCRVWSFNLNMGWLLLGTEMVPFTLSTIAFCMTLHENSSMYNFNNGASTRAALWAAASIAWFVWAFFTLFVMKRFDDWL
ncbi:hypothetical protein SPRG_22286 [Saprolegnia parasitica CBS 223.65]|uniref:Uncharacterized protein n=1 Tax=Saprolegnia parasitica (strain CBS 223.65) TaxID=695850 RepID=A0A067BXI4_SAPPC|nr:hypothetical protein SPRG_22286 [Saprolegnia parasitica CBS 223.65]KDO22998.1 hypothetical protein SPRG_22286 [Saprolegnia parasitica CBS 223.65]|eukprot:XP_012206334.1 hypothetical protein SPRG_22286 [Saprolegnia parasitica CBS 223.65]